MTNYGPIHFDKRKSEGDGGGSGPAAGDAPDPRYTTHWTRSTGIILDELQRFESGIMVAATVSRIFQWRGTERVHLSYMVYPQAYMRPQPLTSQTLIAPGSPGRA